MPGAGNRALPMELHATFTTTSQSLVATGEPVFAVARLRLPAVRPGDVLPADQLAGFSSHAMTLRPEPETSETGDTGTTSVAARLILIRDANRFGASLATALEARAPAAGQGVESVALEQLRGGSYSTERAALGVALVVVRQKQAALDAAKTGGDQDAIAAAEIALAVAQGDANVKAAAASQRLPYPDLTRVVS